MIAACADCLRRTDLIAALAGWLDVEWRRQSAPARVLALSDEQLLDVCGTASVRQRYARFSPGRAEDALRDVGQHAVCRCEPDYPERLRDLPDPPAVLHIAGDPGVLHIAGDPGVLHIAGDPGVLNIAGERGRERERVALEDAVAVIGARRATQYGLTVAHDIGRGLAAVGVSVVSGLALGVDSAAHTGALAGRTPPVAVLAGGCNRPYPPSKRGLYVQVRTTGAIVSEMPPDFGVYRWAFVARNRLIAALARVVVVVEAAERSGSLTTADFGAEIGRTVAAVPGRITCATAKGTNGLLRDGAVLVRHVRDVIDALSELTGRSYESAGTPQPDLEPDLAMMLEAIGAGHSTLPMLVAAGFAARTVMTGLGDLEARGLVRRGFGGRYEPTAF